MVKSLETVAVLNLPLHLSDDYASYLLERSQQAQGAHVVTLNAEMAMLADKDPAVAQVIRQADLVIPDGAGVVIYLKLRGYQQKRCPGIELAANLLEKLSHDNPTNLIAFYGGKLGVAAQAAQAWQQQLPHMQIIHECGYLSREEEENWLKTLAARQPQLILVGLGVPRQEFWIQKQRHLCPQAIWIGVGGSFDIWSGGKERAPKWLRENNLEWLYRLYQEPWRWQRMLVLPQFFWRSLF
jgi:N-acetylglucosaminyldiphosphoundecaprenol N-acetyl-beta-D-mannosaminyltransferase